jgi:hypothetical protein
MTLFHSRAREKERERESAVAAWLRISKTGTLWIMLCHNVARAGRIMLLHKPIMVPAGAALCYYVNS